MLLLGCSGAQWTPPAPAPIEIDGLATPEPVVFTPEDDLASAATSDGRYLVFGSELNGNLDVWVRDFRTNSTYPLNEESPADEFDPAVSPSGKMVAYVSRKKDAKGDIHVVDDFSSGTSAERLTDDKTMDRQPVFAPDGTWLYFTGQVGVEGEFIRRVSLEGEQSERVSPTPGADPSLSSDGRFMVYTEAPGFGQARHAHLVLLRLSDGATRALSREDVPEGLAKFAEPSDKGEATLIYTRFVDDDNGDGRLDADDQASLWRLRFNPEGVFAGEHAAVGRPFPLTDGGLDELFGHVSAGFLYFTQGSDQQDIMRLPISGTFPYYEDVADYRRLIALEEGTRTRWFLQRCIIARVGLKDLRGAEAQYAIGQLHLRSARFDLARTAFDRLVAGTRESADARIATIRALARIELVSLERKAKTQGLVTADERQEAASASTRQLDMLGASADLKERRVAARLALERAEIAFDSGRRTEALTGFDRIVKDFGEVSDISARAMLRRVELQGIMHDLGAVSEAYANIVKAHPERREIVAEAAAKVVRYHLHSLRSGTDPDEAIDRLRYLIERTPSSPIRLAARRRLANVLIGAKRAMAASLELERVVEESRASADRIGTVRALRQLAELDESLELLDEARAKWRLIRKEFAAVPGMGRTARAAITRVNMALAERELEGGRYEAARRAYAEVIDNDSTQVEAHRRYLSTSQRTGHLEEVMQQVRAKVEASPDTPIWHYVLGLAHTWTRPPELDEAQEQIDKAIELNPQFVHAYITRGWIAEMSDLEDPTFWESTKAVFEGIAAWVLSSVLDLDIIENGDLEEAIKNYKTALRLNQEAVHPETEGEILTNLANAHYRLGDQSRDLSNLRIALERYLDVLRLGPNFSGPQQELLFFERLGRCAAWVEDWATSAMATRRALAISEAHPKWRRTSQLRGNLALAYQQAGEELYSGAALVSYEDSLDPEESERRLMIAKRERARSLVGDIEQRGFDRIDSALAPLLDAWPATEELPDVPDDAEEWWIGIGDDVSGHQFGFGRNAEQDVTLSLAERAHRALGDEGRADVLRDARKPRSDQQIEDVPSVFLLFDRYPRSRSMLRENLGLVIAEFRDAAARGELDTARQLLGLAQKRVDDWSGDDEMVNAHGALAIDRARLALLKSAFETRTTGEENAQLVARADESVSAMQAILTAQEISTSSAAATSIIQAPALPLSLSSTAALAQTASIASQQPWLEGLALEGRAVRARHALGRAESAARGLSAGVGQKRDVRALLADLDQQREALTSVCLAYENAARLGLGAGFGLGQGSLVRALTGLASCRAAAGDKALAKQTWSTVNEVARSTADFAGQQRIALAAADFAEAIRLPPQLSAANRGAHARHIAALAANQRAQGDVSAFISAVDRGATYAGAAHSVPDPGDRWSRDDRAAAEGLRRVLLRARAARRDLTRVDANTPDVAYRSIRQRCQQAEAAYAELRDGADVLSDLAAAALFGVPLSVEDVVSVVPAGTLLLVPAFGAGGLEVAWVEGSTTGAAKMGGYTVDVTQIEVSRAVARVRGALAANNPPDVADLSVVRGVFAPLSNDRAPSVIARWGPNRAPRTRPRHLLIASSQLGAVTPSMLPESFDAAAITLSSSPTLATIAQRAHVVGAEGVAVIAADQRASALGERVPHPRRLRVEPDRLEAAPPAKLLVVDAPFFLEPAAPMRSAARLRVATSTVEETTRALRRFLDEVPVDRWRQAAQTVWITELAGTTMGDRAAAPVAPLEFDQTMIARGFATTVLVPGVVPRDVAAALLENYHRRVEHAAPATALRAAVESLRSRDRRVELAMLLGSPGLDADTIREVARANLKRKQKRAVADVRKRRYREAVRSIRSWIQHQLAAEKYISVPFAYSILAGILSDDLDPPNLEEAVAEQRRLVAFLIERKKANKHVRSAEVDLGVLLTRAGRPEEGLRTINEAVAALEEIGDGALLARAYYQRGVHSLELLEDDDGARWLELAFRTYEQAGTYRKKKWPIQARRALERVGAVYLNRLSDPERARRAYLRVEQYAQTDVERVRASLDLVRVARRSGNFAEAARRAEETQAAAAGFDLPDFALDALIEAANVSWYRGDYRGGQVKCEEALAFAERLLSRVLQPLSGETTKSKRKLSTRRIRRSKVYALSACGLNAMSLGRASEARNFLHQAQAIANQLGDQREIATQFNNLGRVYLEFGRLDEATEAFQSAYQIDDALNDRYALGYDLRNLGRAYALRSEEANARQALSRALAYSQEVRDKNNELRTRFALADLDRSEGRFEEALAGYEAALPIAQTLGSRSLAWQIHHGIGLVHRQQDDQAAAEAALLLSSRLASTVKGQAADSGSGTRRRAPFDDLVELYVAQDRAKDAFIMAEFARFLEVTALLNDPRWSMPRALSGHVAQLREASTATGAYQARTTLAAASPVLAELLADPDPDALVSGLGPKEAVVTYRHLGKALAIFVMTSDGLQVERVSITRTEFDQSIRTFVRALEDRADLEAPGAVLAKILLAPIAERIAKRSRLAIVAEDALMRVPFAALPLGDDVAVVDRFTVVYALSPASGIRAVQVRTPRGPEIVAFGSDVPAAGAFDTPLRFSAKEVQSIKESHPGARIYLGDRVTPRRMIDALSTAQGVFHFAGHSLLAPNSGERQARDPLGAVLRTPRGDLTVFDVVASGTRAELVVLSACATGVRDPDRIGGGRELTSLAHGFRLAGAREVIATSTYVDDLTAALVMKRFYRKLGGLDRADALREAQMEVRKLHPHPAWWSTFVVLQ